MIASQTFLKLFAPQNRDSQTFCSTFLKSGKSGFRDHKSSEKINKNCNPYYSNLECDHIHRAAEFASFVYLLGQNIVALL